MFVIQKQDDGYYFHKEGKIILFNTVEEAIMFIQMFNQYSTERLLSEQGPEGIFELHSVMPLLTIIEEDFVETPPCGVVNFEDIKKLRL